MGLAHQAGWPWMATPWLTVFSQFLLRILFISVKVIFVKVLSVSSYHCAASLRPQHSPSRPFATEALPSCSSQGQIASISCAEMSSNVCFYARASAWCSLPLVLYRPRVSALLWLICVCQWTGRVSLAMSSSGWPVGRLVAWASGSCLSECWSVVLAGTLMHRCCTWRKLSSDCEVGDLLSCSVYSNVARFCLTSRAF